MIANAFTQTRLQDFSDCAYRYLLRYVKRVENPTVVAHPMDEYERAVDRGNRLHLMTEQFVSGIPEAAILRTVEDEQVRAWWSRLRAEAFADLPGRLLPEFTLSAALDGIQLTAKIDLLAIEAGRVVIVDWKTSRKASAEQLEGRLQTRVYRWVVSQAAGNLLGVPVAPAQIEMRYWFVQDENPLMSISYSQLQQEQDERYLSALIAKISAENEFVRTTDRRHCQYCAYRSLCVPLLSPARSPLDVDVLDTYEAPASDMELT